MLTSRPRLARSIGIASRLTATAPTKLTSSARRRLSRLDISMVGSKLEMPALLTTASRRPYVVSTCSKHAATDAASVTSMRRTSTPASRRSGSSDGSRIVATTCQPAAAARTAVAWPMPVEVPVTRTTFVMRRPSASSALSAAARSSSGWTRTAETNENAASSVPATIVMRAASRTPTCGVSVLTRAPPARAASGITPHVAVRNAACMTPWLSALIRDWRIGALHTLMQAMKKP